MTLPAVQESAKSSPARAHPRPRPAAAPSRPAPNYATREETMKAVNRIMEEDAEVFRRLADA